MSVRNDIREIPASRQPRSLLAVDRAVSELRRGRMVVVQGGGGRAALVLAAEAVTAAAMAALSDWAGAPARLALTARRAAVLGLAQNRLKVVTVRSGGLTAEAVLGLADPLADSLADPLADPLAEAGRIEAIMADPEMAVEQADEHGLASAAVALAKIARLLPSAVLADIEDAGADDLAAWTGRHDLLLVDAGDVFQYDNVSARTLRVVSEAEVPLLDAEKTRILAFRPDDGGLEHLALVIGAPDWQAPVLTRLHSECFTGDLLGSLRCDCGDQLRGAIAEIAASGGGVLLYLAQEGRGIGLVNKLRAYGLQDRGFDTIDANEQLGFDADERVYLPAAHMLRHLGCRAVRLLTNNPDKVSALGRYGVTVADRVPHAFPSNKHNEHYLATKSARSGHLF